MRTPLPWYAILLGSILWVPLTHSQDIEITTLPEEAEKYYRILQKSPSRDYLYDRFVDAWLKTEPLSQLPVFLESAATREEATLSDQLIAGYFFTRRGDVETALQYFDEAIALEPEHTEALTEKAKLLARGLDFEEALASIEMALSAEEIEEKAILELGKLKGRYLIRQGNTEEAIQVWNELLTEFPEDHYLHEDTVEALANEGLLDEAIKTAQSLVEKTTDAYDRLLRQFRVAELLVLNEETEEAVQLYEVALEQVGAGTWLEGELIARVSALFRRGDDLEGLGEWVATRSEAHPQRIDLLRMRASLAAEFGEDEEAVELYETLLQRSPGDRDIEDGFVDLLASLDRTEGAISQQESIRDLHPEDPSVYLRLAELHAAGEEFEAAGEAILEAFERTEKSELEYLRTAKFLEKYEQPQLSENLLVEGSQAHPESEEIPEALGDLLLQEEKTEEALELLNEIAADANVAQLIRLAQLPVRAGKVEPGLAILQSREEDFPDEFNYLEALIDLSVRAEARESLETLTLHLFSLADTTEKLDRVLKQALTTFADSERREEILEKLAAKESPLPVEVALHALLLHRDGELDQAITTLEEQAGSFEGADRSLLLRQQSYIFRREKDWENAAEVSLLLYEEPGGRTSRNARELIAVFQQAGREEEALEKVVEWKALSPGSTAPWMVEADLLYQMGRGDDAISQLRKGASRFTDSNDVQLKMAKLHFDLGDPAEASRIYWEAFEEAEQVTLKLRRIADLYDISLHTGTIRDLVETLKTRQQSNRTSPVPWLALAEIYRLDKEPAQREAALIEASRLAPDDLALLHQIAKLQLDEGKPMESLATLEKGSRIDETPRTRLQMARIEIEFGDSASGYASLTKLATEIANPDETLDLIVEEIGDSMIRNGDYELAVQYVESYFDEFPENYRLRYLKAVALEELESLEEAVGEFAELLRWEDEMEKPVSAFLPEGAETTSSLREKQMESYWGKLHPDIVPLMRIASISSNAYSHQSGNQGYSQLSIPMLEQRFIRPPMDLPELQKFATVHLFNLANKSEDDEINAEIATVFEECEVESGDTLLLLPAGGLSFSAGGLDADLLAENLENTALLRFWLHYVLYQEPTGGADRDLFLSISDRFLEEDPGLSAAAVFLGEHYVGGSGWEEALDRSLSFLASDDLTEPSAINAAKLAFGQLPYNQHAYGNRRQKSWDLEAIEKLMPAFERSLFAENASPDFSFVQLVFSHYAKSEQFEKMVTLIDHLDELGGKEQTEEIMETMANHAWTSSIYSGIHGLPMDRPHWGVLRFLNPTRDEAGMSNNYTTVKPDLERLEPFLSDPAHLLLISLASEEKEEAMNQIEEFLGKPEVSQDERVLLALAYDQLEMPAEATRMIQEALKAAESVEMKSVLDGAIASYTSRHVKENPELLKTGQQSIERILRMNPPPSYYHALGEKLVALDMQAESTKLLASQQKSQRSTAYKMVSTSTQTAAQKIKDLIDNNKTDEAIKRATKEARNIGRLALAQQHGQWQNHFWELRRAVQEGKIAPKVIQKAIEENGTTNHRKMHEAAIAAELFEANELAVEQYRRILEVEPGYLKARASLIYLVAARTDDEEADQLIAEVEPNELPQLMEELRLGFGGMSYISREAPAKMAVIEKALSDLDRFPDNANPTDYQGAAGLFAYLVNNADWGGIEYANLHDRKPNFSDRDRSYYVSQNEKNDAKRMQVIEDFFSSTKDIEPLSAALFTHKAARSIREGSSLSEWVEAAKETAQIQRGPNMRLVSTGYSQTACFPLYSAEELLIVEAALRENESEVNRVIENADASLQDHLKALSQLYLSSEEEFSERANELLDIRISSTPFEIDNAYHVIWALEAKQLPYESARSLLEPLLRSDQTGHRQAPNWLRTYFFTLTTIPDYPGHERAIRDFRELWFDEDLEEVRKEVEKIVQAGGNFNWGDSYGTFIYGILNTLAMDPAYLFATAEVAMETGYEFNTILRQSWKYRSGDFFATEKPLRAFLADAPWFGSLAEIEFLKAPDFNQNQSLLGEFLAELSDDMPKDVLREILAEKPDSFFKSFLLLLLDQPRNQRNEGGLTLIGDHMEAFLSMEEEQRADWLGLFAKQGIGNNFAPFQPEDTSSAAKAARWLEEEGMKNIEEGIAAFLAANKFTDIKSQPRDFETEMTSLMSRVITRDPERAAKIMLHGWSLIQKEQRSGGWSGTTSYNGWTVASEILDNFIEATDYGLATFPFYLEVIRNDKGGDFPHSGWNHDHRFQTLLRKEIDLHGGNSNLEEALPTVFEKLGNAIGEDPDRYADILTLGYHDLVRKLPRGLRSKAIAIADEIAASESAGARHALNFAMAGRYAMEVGPPDFANDEERSAIPNLTAWRAHALEQIGDDQKPGSYLVPLANLYTFYSDQDDDVEIAITSGRILANALENDHDFNGWNMIHILRDFSAHEAHPEWRGIAERIVTGWWRKNRFNDEARETGKAFDPVTEVILANMDLSCRVGGEDAFTRYRKVFGTMIYGYRYSRIPLMLVTNGRYQDAETVLRKHSDEFDGSRYSNESRYFLIRFNPSVARKVEEFIAQVEDPQLGQFAYALLANAFDPPGREVKAMTEPFVGRTGRLLKAANQFSQIEWTDDKLRRRTLEQIALEPQAISLLAKELETFDSEEVVRESLYLNSSTAIEHGMRIPATKAWSGLRNGNPEAFEDAFEAIQNSSASEGNRNQAIEGLATFLWTALQKRALTMPREELAGFLPALETLTFAYDNNDQHYTDHEEVTCAWIIVASLCGETESVHTWLNQLSEADKRRMVEGLRGHHTAIFPYLSRILKIQGGNTLSTPEVRKQVVIDYFGNPMIQGAFANGSNLRQKLFEEIIKRRLLSPEELLQISTELYDAWPRGGFAAKELSQLAKEAGQAESCLTWGEVALEEFGPKTQEFRRMDLVLTHAENLAAFGQAGRVAATLEKLPREPRPNEKALQRRLEKLRAIR